jgi:hypothetical protein
VKSTMNRSEEQIEKAPRLHPEPAGPSGIGSNRNEMLGNNSAEVMTLVLRATR